MKNGSPEGLPDTSIGAGARMPDGTSHVPDAVVDAAITWAIKLNYSTASPRTHRAFDRWLNADPLHVLAWQRLGHIQRPFNSIPSDLLRATLGAAEVKRARRADKRRSAAKLLSLIGMATGVGWVLVAQSPWQRLLASASTAIGERRTLLLEDGTVIVLNTDSAVSTDLAGDRRLVMLRRGELMVTTGADKGARTKRPFWVYTPFGRMQALGTRFTVRLDGQQARVSVQEGAVALHPLDAANATAVVRAGQSEWLTDNGTRPADLEGFEADGWTDGVVAGKNIRLADLLFELSRYRAGRIVCDERVADLRLSGLFHISDTDQTLQFLSQTQPIRITYRTRFWVSVGPKEDT
ncbi:MAG: FecR domain-containing protein [Aquabacterium sp.]